MLFCKSFHHFDRYGEYNSGVLLGRDLSERLQVSELKRHRTLVDRVGGVFQGQRRFLLSLSGDYFCARFSRTLRFGCHCALHLHRQSHILTEIVYLFYYIKSPKLSINQSVSYTSTRSTFTPLEMNRTNRLVKL